MKSKFTAFLITFILTTSCFAQTNYDTAVNQALDSFQAPAEQAEQTFPQDNISENTASLPLTDTAALNSNPQEETNVPSPAQPTFNTPEPPQGEQTTVAPAGEEGRNVQVSPTDSSVIDVLELKDMDIGDVLKLISKKTGLNIVAGTNVKGKVTIYLKNVAVKDVLKIILESNNMAFADEGNIIRVMTDREFEQNYGHKFAEKTQVKTIQLKNMNSAQALVLLNQMKSTVGKIIADEKTNTLVMIDTSDKLPLMESFIRQIDVPISTKVFDLSYAQAEDLSKKISEALTKNVGTVKFDKRSNKVIVTDTPQSLDAIEKMVTAFDEKHQEVLIESRIVQVVLNNQYKLGIDWQAVVRDYHSLNLAGNFSVLGAADKRGKLSIGTIDNDDYQVLIEALETVGTTNILSSPHITAINNEEAKILVGSTEPYVTTTTTTPATGPTTTAESVNFIDVGVKLYVTPTIHKDRNITMKIKPEVSSVTSFLTTGNNNRIPVVETSEAETTVMAKDGVTIVIGGLIKDEKVDSINKIPLLGDIPFLGAVFRNKNNSLRKTELVIFLTPKIITGDVSETSSGDGLSLKSDQK